MLDIGEKYRFLERFSRANPPFFEKKNGRNNDPIKAAKKQVFGPPAAVISGRGHMATVTSDIAAGRQAKQPPGREKSNCP
jgi:hypothetical protein